MSVCVVRFAIVPNVFVFCFFFVTVFLHEFRVKECFYFSHDYTFLRWPPEIHIFFFFLYNCLCVRFSFVFVFVRIGEFLFTSFTCIRFQLLSLH